MNRRVKNNTLKKAAKKTPVKSKETITTSRGVFPHRKKTLLERLEIVQKEALNSILDKLDKGKKLKKSDLSFFVDFTHVTSGDICKVLGVGRPSLMLLTGEHPEIKNADGTYNLIRAVDIIRIGSDRKNQATLGERYYYQIEKLKLEIQEKEELSISKEEHERIFSSLGHALNVFLTQTAKMNLHKFENKTVKELKFLFTDYNRQMMNMFISGKVKE